MATKRDMVLEIAEKTNLKQEDVRKVMQLVFDSIIKNLSTSGKMELRKFGVFKVKIRKGREGRNPKTGEGVTIPDRKVVIFKAGREMRDCIEHSA